MSDNKTPCQATPGATLREQIMDSRIPKNEREWWAARTIEKLERELAEAKQESRTKDGVKWSDVSDLWRHKFEAAERELANLQEKSAREVFARGVYLGPKGTGLLPKQFAPEWWYNCFNKGYHDMSIFEIEWGYDAYLKRPKTTQ